MTAPVPLAVDVTGRGPTLVLLHGLYGSGRNLGGVARGLGDRFRVISVDLRNHGRSPWAAPMTYPAMEADVAALLEADGADRVRLLGHSMGGKVAMALALRRPDLVERLVVVDVAPVAYAHDQLTPLRAMRDLDLDGVSSRAEADRRLAESLSDRQTRGFLLQNLVRDDRGGFRWRINLSLVERHMADVLGFPAGLLARPFPRPVLLISGEKSPYVDADGVRMLQRGFADVTHTRMPGAGHLPHVERPDAFLAALRAFLQ